MDLAPRSSESLLADLDDPSANAWVAQARAELVSAPDPAALRTRLHLAWARSARKLDATMVDRARAVLLSAALEHTPLPEQVDLVEELYRKAELGEQASVLRSLPCLPDPDRFVPLAIDACRTNALPVFAAIAQHNPLPAAHFPEPAFNQLVLKAVFLGVSVAAIEGLEQRAGAELRRMASAYADERRAAERPVPTDIDLILAACDHAAQASP